MNSDEYTLKNVSISELSDLTTIESISDESFVLVSQPNEYTESKYMSVKMKYSDLRSAISSEIGIEKLENAINDIYTEYISHLSADKKAILSGITSEPYLLSSIYEHRGSIEKIEGCKLYDALDTVFKSKLFDRLSVTNLNASYVKNTNLTSDGISVSNCDSEPKSGSQSVLNSNALKNTMNKYFMSGYSNANQLTHKDFVNSSIDHVAAYYITKKHTGETKASTFRTYSDLSSAKLSDLYWGETRRNPTKNDYCVVLSDETQRDPKYGNNPRTTRYLFTALSCDERTYNKDMWTFQYIVNTAPFTDEQWKRINGQNASYGDYGIVKVLNNSGIGIGNGVISVDYPYIKTKIESTSFNTLNTNTLCAETLKIEGKDFSVIGQNCDIAYTTPNGLVKQGLMNQNIYVCENDEEIEQARKSEFSFKNVFETWQKTGTYDNNTKWYGYTNYPLNTTSTDPAGYPFWYYDDVRKTIVQPKNTYDGSMYVSINKYKNYDITTRFYSTNPDDDYISFIGAFAIDKKTNLPKYLQFVRTCQWREFKQDTKYWRWVVYTHLYYTSLSSKVQSDLYYGDGKYVPNDQYTGCSYGWQTANGGTLVRVRRVGDMISAWTTPFLSSDNDASRINSLSSSMDAMIVVDLNDVCGGIFTERNGGGSVGFGATSQASSMYQVLNFDAEKTIVDIRDKSLSTYNPITKQWELQSIGFNTLSSCGFGRLVKNELTQKVFYVNQNTFSKVNNSNMNINIDTTQFTQSTDRVPCSKLVYDNMLGISSMIQTQITKLKDIV